MKKAAERWLEIDQAIFALKETLKHTTTNDVITAMTFEDFTKCRWKIMFSICLWRMPVDKVKKNQYFYFNAVLCHYI